MEYSGIMDSADNAGMGIVQHYDVPSEHTRMLCLDGMKVLNSYTVGCVLIGMLQYFNASVSGQLIDQFVWILRLECWHLTVSLCSSLLLHVHSVAHIVINCLCVMDTAT
jgi:hypothetical protein